MQRKNQPKMGKSRFGILLGRKSSKFVCYLKHAITRNSYLKNRQQALYSCSISDVVQLLHLGHQHHALLRVILLLILFVSILEITQFYSSIVLKIQGELRILVQGGSNTHLNIYILDLMLIEQVEHVIESKNMLDVFDMIDSYCNFLAQNVSSIQKSKECPEEYKEAIGSLIFASSRIGDFPELQHIRNYFTSKFGQEFIIQALESPTCFGVNDKIIQKLSRSRPSLETKFNFVKEIAPKNEIRVNWHQHADIQQH
ncbi:uncharacterized protein LOC130803831 [Amaranthus tricolor]|uniref:uncharacterized protein LOC130803831 n=1 Tax=Amaranthus tricolor TaxID=29722 RepID=UPI002584D6C3|nr:uncharacterized protein LOC130803831 [Amaranthus tricolor]